ncbi:MAG: SGNH/GDSL hydrolase family protein [Clostridia bacterium]|nr:SGNH/GDSL hydrolase family protein [Clostridia bacterium]
MKKVVCLILCMVMVCGSLFIMGACEKEEPIKIVYLGDSIAEGLAGPSPVSERNNYAYYSIIGRCNGFEYYNRSVSGHKTGQLLSIIRKEDYGANMTRTHIKEADIIHISILGNDVLLSGFGPMLIEAAQDRYDRIDSILVNSKQNIANIVDELKTLNPNAVLIFQTVYNPGDPDCILIFDGTKQTLAEMGFEEEDYREVTSRVLIRLNAVLWDYLDEHPNAFYIADAYKDFDEVYKADRARGNRLISNDWIHPSNEGHAVAALTTQKLLESLELADKDFLKRYKEIRTEQLERMFAETVDYKTINRSIKKADTYEEVSRLYFDATLGITPKYY